MRQVRQELMEVEEVQKQRDNVGVVLKKWEEEGDNAGDGRNVAGQIFEGLRGLSGYAFDALEGRNGFELKGGERDPDDRVWELN